MLDLYCERTAPGLLNEPLNLVTNLAFVVAAMLALRRFRQQPNLGVRNGWDLLLLIGLLFAIGIGSGLFHGFAERWSLLADVIPILLLINTYLLSWLYRVAAAPVWVMVLIFVGYQGVVYAWAQAVPPESLNGSVGYAPALFFLAGMWLYLTAYRHPMARTLGAATGTFVASLLFRTLDAGFCNLIPFGTHFLWHLLNGLVLYLLIDGLIRFRSRPVELCARAFRLRRSGGDDSTPAT